jgi:hypothetical protein
MKIIKYLVAVSGIFGMILFSGCKDDFTLELEPVSSLTDASYWKTAEHWEAVMNGIHSRMRTHQLAFLKLGEWRSDIWGCQPFTGGNIVDIAIHMNTINEENPGITSFAGFYSNINQINLIIDKSLKKEVLSESDKNFYLGQAYGMRAYYYFHLLRSWGDVIIQEEPSYGFNTNEMAKAASPASKVMEFIKDDIARSENAFGNIYTFKKKVLWSKAATLMLKGEVFLWSAKQMDGGNADASVAKAALTEIQTNIGSLKLLPNYRDIFRYDNKENAEIIFAIRNAQDEYLQNWDDMVPRLTPLSQCTDSLTGKSYSATTHNVLTIGGGFYAAVFNRIYNAYSAGDLRKFESLQAGYILKDGNYIQQTGVWQNKFQGSFYKNLRQWNDDTPIYRYSDLLLLLAEAKFLMNENPANEINLVRKRAFGGNYNETLHGYPNQTIDKDFNEAILKERLLEFVAEGKRWYDLRRFGVAYVTKYTLAQPTRLLWPIDKNSLTQNPALEQTSGY